MPKPRLRPRPNTIPEFLAARRPRVIAHRGFSGAAPENTLAAFRRAIDLGADMIELDVLLSRDDELIVIHDLTLERTTNGVGPVREWNLAQLHRLDAGSWFGPEFASEPLPTLAEVFDVVNGKTLVNVEIKNEAVTDQLEGGITDRVCRLVRDHGMTDAVILSSFEPRALVHAHTLAPEIARAALLSQSAHAEMQPAQILGAADCVALHLGCDEVDDTIVEQCHQLGKLIAVYTVNDPGEMRRMIDLGVDALFTDWPDRMLAVIQRGPEGREQVAS